MDDGSDVESRSSAYREVPGSVGPEIYPEQQQGSIQAGGNVVLGDSEEVVSPPPPPSTRNRRHISLKSAVKLVPEPIKSSLKPPESSKEWLDFFFTKFPILGWVWGYKFNYFIGDIIAGITVAIMHIPQGLAYALLANVQPIYGLYASFVPVLVYSILGTSKHISVGTFAVVELMIGNSVDRVIAGNANLTAFCLPPDAADSALLNATAMGMDGGTTCRMLGGAMAGEAEGGADLFNMTFGFMGGETDCEGARRDIVITLAMLSGIIMFVMGIFQLGFITIFLSEPLISGYTTGAAMHVFTSQLQHITGLADTIKVPNGPLKVPKTWIAMFANIGCVNWATILISVVAMIFLIIFKILNKLLKSPKIKVPIKVYRRTERKWITKKFPWPIPIPSQLIVVIVGTVIAYTAKLDIRYGVIPVADIPTGLPSLTVPKAQLMPSLIQDAFVISIVTFAVTVSLAKVFAREYGYSINSNQEFLAYGAMNIVGSFFSSFTAAGSLSRSSIQASAGGKTQLVGFISSIIIFIVLLQLGVLFEPLPRAILASIIWVALYGMFKQFKDVYKYWKLSWWDAAVWLVVYLATTFLGVDLGLGVGVGFSLLVIVLRIILPTSTVLGEAHESQEVFRSLDNFEKVDTIPGILVFRFQAPLCFVNCRVFRLRLEIACGLLHKTALKLNRNTEGCLQVLCYKAGVGHKGSYTAANAETVSFHANNASVNIQNSQSDISNINHFPSIEAIHTVIIDCAPIGFMDAVGVKTLQEIVTDFDKLGVQVLFVCMTKENREIMGRVGFFKKCSKKWLFPSMQGAIRHAQYEPVLHPLTSEQMVTAGDGDADNDDASSLSSQQDDDNQAGPRDRHSLLSSPAPPFPRVTVESPLSQSSTGTRDTASAYIHNVDTLTPPRSAGSGSGSGSVVISPAQSVENDGIADSGSIKSKNV